MYWIPGSSTLVLTFLSIGRHEGFNRAITVFRLATREDSTLTESDRTHLYIRLRHIAIRYDTTDRDILP